MGGRPVGAGAVQGAERGGGHTPFATKHMYSDDEEANVPEQSNTTTNVHVFSTELLSIMFYTSNNFGT